ncbi:hypothetical protein HYFRA_00011526 [Hymenoscyphus fraxineus]|uniref:Polyketide synthase n=1 Tax=Hymenoscyphus fraxineus TaxID=746836 RepID=A0A9N9PLP7_9HELO|nr:hypothetical protein HYFRA_00011526 [Hymenoscyphus fraxineus]
MMVDDPLEPIAIIGSGCRFPGDTNTPSKLWELLKSPRDLLRQIPPERYDAEAFYNPDPKHHGTTDVRQSYFLNEDPASFDHGFFNIQPGEAEAVDPQQRMLMETVYDSLCAAGQTIEGLRGTPTAVYVGLMCDDWSGMITKDLEVFPQYGATGIARSIISNRVSYFFDWHGPSMTIDTACSSSREFSNSFFINRKGNTNSKIFKVVAVHQAIQTLRSGESQVAIAAGANLILTPDMYVAESKLSMLSPGGRSRMWDKDVDGYARGEGIAAIVLKPLSAALRDNDHIECLIRATGINQDGKTQGITMPSATAQANLIRSTYARAGLDINKLEDRPQFFHAHGTGTPAGDPREAEAISRAFYSSEAPEDKLYVGSIKTIIGHTEGTAGLASLIGTSLAIQHGTIPPNMHFNVLNPRLAEFYHHLEVPTKPHSWPETSVGQVRRASVNSFGFGGTNAHAILEAYEPRSAPIVKTPLYTPLTFSASSENSLLAMLSDYSQYLKSNHQESLYNLAYTLQARRSTLAHRVAIAASTANAVISQIDDIISGEKQNTVSTRQLAKMSPRILGVFTGQGAQWPRMGAKLLELSPYVAQRLSELDHSLSDIHGCEKPTWTLRELILANSDSSRMSEAAISQPVCTAVQIVLVDLLGFAGIKLHAVVGHSSGEIGAAYAAGFLKAQDAIRIAYFRGLYAHLAMSPHGGKGAMMAVGTTFEDASDFCELEAFKGRIQIAARNSSSSITLSGDEDAVVDAIAIFKDEGKFARQLKVDTAYHSSHVLPCAKPYLAAMEGCGIHSTIPTGVKWYSSVIDGKLMGLTDLNRQYWVENMIKPVQFSPAVAQACANSGPFDLVLEIGPHPVLKTPCLDTLEGIVGHRPPYSGLLSRDGDDVQVFSAALGFIWTHLGAGSVAFDAFSKAVFDQPEIGSLVTDLPKYPFDHSRQFMSLSRLSGLHHSLQGPPHPLLGKRCHDRETSQMIQWRNILQPKEISWLNGHQIQGQIVFPATGYIAMAVEAISIIAGKSSIGLVSIEDLHIGRAMAFDDEDSSIETLFHAKIINQNKKEIHVQFACNSGSPHDHGSAMILNAHGFIKVDLSSQEPQKLPVIEIDDTNTSEVAIGRFYDFLTQLGYNYSWPFHGTTSIRRKANYATGTIEDQSGTEQEDRLIVHPGMLDTALQTTFAAFCCPGDERLWTLHVPTSFKSIIINPYFTPLGVGKQTSFQYSSVARDYIKGQVFTDINLLAGEDRHVFLQIEGMKLVPFSVALPENDAVLFSRFDYKVSNPDGGLAAAGHGCTPEALQVAVDSERISFYYLRRLIDTITDEEKANTLPHYQSLLEWAAYVVSQVIRGENPHIPEAAQHDTQLDIDALLKKHYERTDIRLLESVGTNIPNVIRDKSNILEHMTKDGMLDDVYESGFGLEPVNRSIAQMTAQIAHRYPRMNILEIELFIFLSQSNVRLGAGTGGSTRSILPQLGSAFSTYTYTDVSSAFFGIAEDRFKDYANRMIFKTFDMNKSPVSQGFIEESYDLVIASNVLHATLDVEQMLKHVRTFLKPGGYLVILEIVNNDFLRVGLPMGCLPGWWLGAESGRRWGPTLTLPQWDSLLRKSGFGGIDTTTPSVHKILPGHVFCAQALDDRIDILRSPLADIPNLPITKAPQLVVIGGESLDTHKISEELCLILGPRFGQIIRLSSFEMLSTTTISESSSVISLTELENPLFSTMNAGKLDALKTLWHQSGNILWVTTGARAINPHCYMTLGVGRCMRFEYPNITLEMLDIDRVTNGTSALIAEHFIRLEVLDKWSRELRKEDLLWSLEPEIYVENDITVIPRLYPYDAGNKRYNTSRRTVSQIINLQESKLLLAGDNESWEVRIASPLHISTPLSFTTDMQTIHVTNFLLSTISMLPGCRLMVCTGVNMASSENVLAVTHSTETPVSIPSSWCIPIGKIDPIKALGVFSAHIMARTILRLSNTGDQFIIHDPHPTVANAMHAMADDNSVRVHFTTSTQKNVKKGWHYLPENISERVVRQMLPSNATKFINMSLGREISAIEKLIVRCLPPHCEIIDPSRLFGTGAFVRAFVSESEVSYELKLALKSIDLLAQGDTFVSDVPAIQIQDISDNQVIAAKQFAIADCTSPSITAAVSAIDEGTIFQPDKTYFFVGLSGELGQSLCRWMVAHGARYMVLTSRSPNVHPNFLREMENMGATIKVMSMDITDRQSLYMCHESITKSMPPIGGVANGAMVLEDCLFENMSYEGLTKVLSPKVLGSQLLDELFHDAPLDFFILFSSGTAVIGNTGQSNYIAANMFMNSLAAQRKKRGVAGSSINISPVIGIGYVERAEDLSEDNFTKIGYKPMSEQDVQLLFAEAIVLGRPDSSEICELTTGITPTFTDAQFKDQYLKDVKFSHFLMERQSMHEKGGKVSSVPVRLQLAGVKTKAEAISIIRESFMVRLRRILAVSPEEVVSEKVTLVEQGIDSLMAVEVRTWFLKELDVDLPVLKILGGSSINDLLDQASTLLPPSVVAFSALAVGQEPMAGTSSDSSVKTGASPGSFRSVADDAQSITTLGSTTVHTEVDTLAPLNVSMSSPPFNCERPGETSPTQHPSGTSNQLPDESSSPMSFGQAGFWFLNEYLSDKKAFNMAVMLKLTGSIDISSLETAVEAIGKRHEILRTRFFYSIEGNDRTPMQGIRQTSATRLSTKRLASEAEADLELQRIHDKEWDLSSGDTVNISLLSLNDQTHFLLIGMHHIFLDGYSFSIYFKDLEAAYRKHTLPSLAAESQYRYFATQQRQLYENGGLDNIINHYRKELSTQPKPIELLPFAKTVTREVVNYSQHEATVHIDASLAAKIRQLARQNRSTSFHVYLSAVQALLFKLLPETSDIWIGIADANRGNKDTMNSVGFFLNLLPLHFRGHDSSSTVDSTIRTARDIAYEALQYSQLPFDVLLRELQVPRSNAHTPIFQVFLDYRQVVQERANWGDCKIEDEKWRNAATGYDISLEITEKVNSSTAITLRLQDSLYSQENTQLFLRSYIEVLDFMVENPQKYVQDIRAWSTFDLQTALSIGKAHEFNFNWKPTISHRIDEVIRDHSSEVALKDGNGNELTYGQMEVRIDAIDRVLRDSGTIKGAIVGVFQEPSSDWICSMLAILRAGAVYVPLDLRNSIPRLASIVKAAVPTIILTDSTTTTQVDSIGASNAREITVSSLSNSQMAVTSLPNLAMANAQAVILFTSGSTGEPKGLVMTHGNIVASAEASSTTFANSQSRLIVLQQSPFSFDLSLDQIFAALAKGGCLVIVPARSRGDPIEISKIMIAERVTYTCATPSEYAMWMRYGVDHLRRCKSWEYAFSGGEAMSHGLALEFSNLELPGLHLFNGYGPAETTMYSTKIELNWSNQKLPDPLPAGFMLPGYSVCIVDSNLQPVPSGVSGEIIIGGPCVVSGYLNDAELTNQKFIPDVFFGGPNKVHRTGDKGHLLGDGTLFCDGRLDGDTQVKVRGFRVEMEEVEKVLVKYAAGVLLHAVVTLRGHGEGSHLVAHVVFVNDYPLEKREEKVHSLCHSLPLPAYMRPSMVIPLTDIPKTPHLKIDRKSIEAMPLPSKRNGSYASNTITNAERIMSELWRDIMPIDPGPLTADSDFFLAGGNSILLVKLQSMIQKSFHTTPKLVTLMGATTLREMATTADSLPAGKIDWEVETGLPVATQRVTPTLKRSTERSMKKIGFTVLLTGSAGFLGRHLLKSMIGDSKIAQIILLLRHVETAEILEGLDAEKVTIMEADLSKPHLSLEQDSFDTLADDTDVIVHCAANRSFWDRYEVLRPDNVDSVKELTQLAALHAIPMHFISSGAVASYIDTNTKPPEDGSDGYVSTKWAAEVYLGRAASMLNIPITIHRPMELPKSYNKTPGENASLRGSLITQLVAIIDKLGMKPSFENVEGSVDVIPIKSIVQTIHEAVKLSTNSADLHSSDSDPMRILQHEAVLKVFVEEFATELRGHNDLSNLPSLPILEWFGEAKKMGFGFFMTAQNLQMGSKDGYLVSRR